MELNKDAIRLLDRLYKDLYLNKQVLHYGNGNKYDKFNNIASYLSKLESTHNKISTSDKHIKYLKKCYYDKYVIKKEEIPESYYKNQEQMALDRGFGHINIDAEQRAQLQNEVIENQKRSLDTWIDYFLSEDSKVYPFWAKYWAFQGMLNLGYFDKEKSKFYKRTKNTVYPFCDLNREAFSMSIDLLIKSLNKETINDKDLEILVKSGSFQKIYTYILTKVLNDNKNIAKRNIGKWVKYDQGSDHMSLVNSLQGYNTGWCTAGESTAESQLQGGDFYVYYTLDDNDEYKVPRIAIRMEYGSIREIRGVAKDQNIEPDMEKVVEEKLNEFPDKESYYKKVNDMKILTEIYKKHNNNNLELTKEELVFLYEINDKIEGFGYKKDPRIEEITNSRNMKKDLSQVFDCKEEQISLDPYELNDDTVYYVGHLLLVEGMTLVFPKYVKGDVILEYNELNDVVFPEYIGGSLKCNNLKKATNVIFPKYIGERLELFDLENYENITLPKHIGGFLHLDSLKKIESLILPERIDYDLCLKSLKYAKNITFPKYIGGRLYLDGLESVEGLDLLPVIKCSRNGISLRALKSADDLRLPKEMTGSLFLSGLKNADNLILPEYIGGYLDLQYLENADSLIFPKYIGEDLCLQNLKTVKNVIFPKKVEGSLFLGKLECANNVVLPEYIGGILDIGDLKEARNLFFPKTIKYTLDLANLKIAENLTLPNYVGGHLCLNNLDNIDELALPKNISLGVKLTKLESFNKLILPESILPEFSLNLLNVINYDNLIFPEKLIYNIKLKNFTITPENVDEYRNKKKLT